MTGEGSGGGRSRPYRRPNAAGGRSKRYEVRVTEEESERLVALAAQQRVTVPRLMFEAAMAGSGETSAQRRNLIEELFAAHRLLGSLANNMNQIAKATNSTREVQPEMAVVQAKVRDTAERIDELVDQLAMGR